MNIVYEGPSSRQDNSTEFIIRDAEGKPHTLRTGKGRYTEVPDELGKELVQGSDRTKGHKFSEYTEPKPEGANASNEASTGNRRSRGTDTGNAG